VLRITQLIIAMALLCALTITGAAVAADQRRATTPPAQAAPAAAKKHDRKIHEAWPHKENGKKPATRLGRKLARQVGPIRISRRKQRSSRAAPRASANRGSSAGGSPGVVGVGAGEDGRLLLVRSFDIPKDDPLYADLSNYSWTYDNALAALAFVADGSRSQARELLDQLAALQNNDGSINFAFDVQTGGSSSVVRSGAAAWVGLAAAAFRREFGSKSYDPMMGGLVGYLMELRNDRGLVVGGPDVPWVSTQHNLLTAELLRDLHEQGGQFGGFGPDELAEAEASISAAIDKQLLVDDGDQVHFKEGLEDERIPIDVQALGAMYLQTRGDQRATQVAEFMLQKGFFIPTHASREAGDEVSGLRPFLDPEAPNVIWTEGTIESQFALTRLELEDSSIAAAVKSLAATMRKNAVGPIGADRQSVTSWGEYRTWPTSAATSWLLMLKRSEKATLFSN
jgi:hypothetical protein